MSYYLTGTEQINKDQIQKYQQVKTKHVNAQCKYVQVVDLYWE